MMADPPVPPAAGLQFDKADFSSGDAAAVACAACQAPIAGEYYDVNGQAVCPGCKAALERSLSVPQDAGTFLKAAAGGVAGGIVGAAIYFGVLVVSGYEIGIIAIAVGWLAGKGVSWGTGGRGGPLYQALAMAITYVAIVSTHVMSLILHTIRLQGATFGELVGRLDWLKVLVEPFLDGVENIIGIVILGIGLYEAWKINRRVPLTITGPFHAAFRPASAPTGAPGA